MFDVGGQRKVVNKVNSKSPKMAGSSNHYKAKKKTRWGVRWFRSAKGRFNLPFAGCRLAFAGSGTPLMLPSPAQCTVPRLRGPQPGNNPSDRERPRGPLSRETVHRAGDWGTKGVPQPANAPLKPEKGRSNRPLVDLNHQTPHRGYF